MAKIPECCEGESKLTEELIQTSVWITKQQRKFLRDNFVNFSKLMRSTLNKIMEDQA